MMQFNPLFLEKQSPSDGNGSKPSKFNSPNYMFSDIIKVYTSDEHSAAKTNAAAKRDLKPVNSTPEHEDASIKSRAHERTQIESTAGKVSETVSKSTEKKPPEQVSDAKENNSNNKGGSVELNALALLEKINIQDAQKKPVAATDEAVVDDLTSDNLIEITDSVVENTKLILDIEKSIMNGSTQATVQKELMTLQNSASISESSSPIISRSQMSETVVDAFTFETFSQPVSFSYAQNGSDIVKDNETKFASIPLTDENVSLTGKEYKIAEAMTAATQNSSDNKIKLVLNEMQILNTSVLPEAGFANTDISVNNKSIDNMLKDMQVLSKSVPLETVTEIDSPKNFGNQSEKLKSVTEDVASSLRATPEKATEKVFVKQGENTFAAAQAKAVQSIEINSGSENITQLMKDGKVINESKVNVNKHVDNIVQKPNEESKSENIGAHKSTDTVKNVSPSGSQAANTEGGDSKSNSEAALKSKQQSAGSEYAEVAAVTKSTESNVISKENLNNIMLDSKVKTNSVAGAAKAAEAETIYKTLKTEDIFKELNTVMLSRERQKIVYSLDPESLGKMRLSMETSNNAVKANIEVESDSARKSLESNIQSLKQSLEESGTNNVSINVTVKNQDGKHGKGNAQKRKSNSHEQNFFSIDEVNNAQKKYGYNTYEYLA